MGQYFYLLLVSGNCIGVFWGKLRQSPPSWVQFHYDSVHASGHSPEDKIEEQINFALRHARLYLAESYDEQDDKYSAENTFDISWGGGGSSSSLSAITVSVSVTSNVVCC